MFESDIEKFVIELLRKEGFVHLSPEALAEEREQLDEVVLIGRLRKAVEDLNHDANETVRERAIKEVLELNKPCIADNNEDFYRMLIEGISIEIAEDGHIRGKVVRLIDFENIENNDFVVTNQFSVHGTRERRPDVALFVNGLPIVVIELKNPEDENATTYSAYKQLQTYKQDIPNLFFYNGILVASDGFDARAGSLSADWNRFVEWKDKDGAKKNIKLVPQIETLVSKMLNKKTLLDLVRNFTVFEKTKQQDKSTGLITVETIKKIGAYHQYHAVNKAVAATREAAGKGGTRRGGVVWHTQGSGKSLSMVFYTAKLVQELNNPTVVVITDRNDLDD